MKKEDITGIVFKIQRSCLEDGPGIRSIVFLKGCNLRCAWCHNPESFHQKPDLFYLVWKCVQCGACEKVCQNAVHRIENKTHSINRSKCIGCGVCEKFCLHEAVKVIGFQMTVHQVMMELKKDLTYFKESGGGVTFSGGEASTQFHFLKNLLMNCKKEGIHTVLETNGVMEANKLKELATYTDLFLFDYKLASDALYKKYTKHGMQEVMESLLLLQQLNKEVVLRCPIIPGINDTIEHFESIKKLRNQFSNISSVDFMAYHDTGKVKWDNLGYSYEMGEITTATLEQKNEWISYITP